MPLHDPRDHSGALIRGDHEVHTREKGGGRHDLKCSGRAAPAPKESASQSESGKGAAGKPEPLRCRKGVGKGRGIPKEGPASQSLCGSNTTRSQWKEILLHR